MVRLRLIPLLAILAAPSGAAAQSLLLPSGESQTAQDLKRLTLEQLAELDVTSASRRPERLSAAAAAVSIITTDDIRRSGVATLVDAARLADGVDVTHANPSTWSVTARGFNISTANKLLVMVDGRTVYSPLFAGTFWDVQDLVLDDVERIEVVRGPGGATWGANAVNGVVNVITKSAAETRGSYAHIATGTTEHAIVSGRYGARIGDWGNYRVFGKFRQREAGVLAATGESIGNDLATGRTGFRLESDESRATRWLLQGDAYLGSFGLAARPDGDLGGGHLLGRWSRRFSATSEFRTQVYYDRTWRKVPLQFEENRDTVDVDTQHRLLLAHRHDVVFGGGFRVSHGDDRGTAGFFFDPDERTHELFSFFVNDEIALRADRLFLIAGSKFERNDFTGFELQPTIRLRWSRNGRETLWGAVSRAVRLPTRFDTDLRIINPVTGRVLITGTEDFAAESVVAFEGGYRFRPFSSIALDVAAYGNRYDNLRSQELPTRPNDAITLENFLNAVTSGIEVGATFIPTERWRLHGSYSYFHRDFSFDAGSTDATGGSSEANDPSHLISLRSYLDLPGGFALDGTFRGVSSRPSPEVPAYAELNLRLGYTLRPGWDVSIVGQNLLHDRHAELFTANSPRYEFRRGAYIRSVWRF